jgi:hypothetical protein
MNSAQAGPQPVTACWCAVMAWARRSWPPCRNGSTGGHDNSAWLAGERGLLETTGLRPAAEEAEDPFRTISPGTTWLSGPSLPPERMSAVHRPPTGAHQRCGEPSGCHGVSAAPASRPAVVPMVSPAIIPPVDHYSFLLSATADILYARSRHPFSRPVVSGTLIMSTFSADSGRTSRYGWSQAIHVAAFPDRAGQACRAG